MSSNYNSWEDLVTKITQEVKQESPEVQKAFQRIFDKCSLEVLQKLAAEAKE
ncbi:hypothetical protein [Nostoc sp.]|uniref:hypothetical protein n=1 Tax=Nostoc sp. TaxID=1180 RepID=UPI002FF56DF5